MQDVRQGGSPSPTIALNLCFVAMIVSDVDGNDILDSFEYAAFCNQISGGQFINVAYDDLAAPLKDAAKLRAISVTTASLGSNILYQDTNLIEITKLGLQYQ